MILQSVVECAMPSEFDVDARIFKGVETSRADEPHLFIAFRRRAWVRLPPRATHNHSSIRGQTANMLFFVEEISDSCFDEVHRVIRSIIDVASVRTCIQLIFDVDAASFSIDGVITGRKTLVSLRFGTVEISGRISVVQTRVVTVYLS